MAYLFDIKAIIKKQTLWTNIQQILQPGVASGWEFKSLDARKHL